MEGIVLDREAPGSWGPTLERAANIPERLSAWELVGEGR